MLLVWLLCVVCLLFLFVCCLSDLEKSPRALVVCLKFVVCLFVLFDVCWLVSVFGLFIDMFLHVPILLNLFASCVSLIGDVCSCLRLFYC